MKALIVVDMQNDFITGSLGTAEAQEIVSNVKKKIQEYQSRGDKIIFTRDTHYSNYLQTQEGKNLPVEHCIMGESGWNIAEGLDDVPNCFYIDKETFGSNKLPSFIDNRIKEIELVGLCTDICVISNAIILKAAFPETIIKVDASCCAGVTPESHQNALSSMKMCQIKIVGE